MNIVIILSGGVGLRFGSSLPKQYHKINGQPIIDYVIQAARAAQAVDRIVVVCDASYVDYSPELVRGAVDFAPQGADRNESLKHGIDFVAAHYDCAKVCVTDAVRPFVTAALFDDYFARLDEYDVVVTCEKITGELGDYDNNILDRSKYYITESPEAFRFPLLLKHFSLDMPSTEVANHLPKTCRRYRNFDFKGNMKITYDVDLGYAAAMLEYRSHQAAGGKR